MLQILPGDAACDTAGSNVDNVASFGASDWEQAPQHPGSLVRQPTRPAIALLDGHPQRATSTSAHGAGILAASIRSSETARSTS